MTFNWRNISVQNKMLIICLLIIVFMTASIFGYLLPRVKESIINTKKANIADMVNMIISSIDSIYADYKSDKISFTEAQKRAINYVKSVRYGPENLDYFWINDFQPKMIAHPYNAALEGKDLNDYKDPNGKKLFLEMVNVCNKSGSGYVSYMWQWKDQKDMIVPKISYVKAYKPFDWIIGTGLYLKDVEAQVQDELNNIYIRLAAVSLAIMAVTFLIIFFFGKSIRKQINLGINFARGLASGDLTGRIGINQDDEFGQLGNALDTAANNLEGLVSKVLLASQNLAQAVNEISGGNQNLSQRTSEQASSIEEIASTLEETTGTIKLNAENAVEARKLANASSAAAVEGGKLVSDTVESINEINTMSKKIGEIISVINEIAFQTNLLALNAAVEAARAGEQGRSFAIVAGEVRNLAQRTAGASKEIGQLIKDSISKIEYGTQMSNKSGEALKTIIESVKKVDKMIIEIAAASEEQRQGIEQINTAIGEMDTITQQNASLVEETASASEEMSMQAQELYEMMQKFKINNMLMRIDKK